VWLVKAQIDRFDKWRQPRTRLGRFSAYCGTYVWTAAETVSETYYPEQTPPDPWIVPHLVLCRAELYSVNGR